MRERSLASEHPNRKITELRRNYLANERISDPDLLHQFRSSGLTHLLALSGGQTAPAAVAICYLIALLLAIVVQAFHSTNIESAFNKIRFCICLMHTAIVFFLVGLYQSSGALNRNLSSLLSRSVNSYAVLSHSTRKKSAIWLRPFLLATPWIFGWILHRNPVQDISFLLASLGGISSQLVQNLVRSIMKERRSERMFKHSDTKIMQLISKSRLSYWFTSWIIGTALTSSLMCLLTWPLWPPEDIAQKIYANILAGPCVLFIVTPASLGICVSLCFKIACVEQVFQQILNFGLHTLCAIAESFSSTSPISDSKTEPLFQVISSRAHGGQPGVLALTLEVLCLTAFFEFARRLAALSASENSM